MTPARVARAFAVALTVGCVGATACRPADARNSIDTAELSKREARLAAALGGVDSAQADTSSGLVDTAITADTVVPEKPQDVTSA